MNALSKEVDQFRYIKIQPKTVDLMEYEALGHNYRFCGVYFREPRAEVYCVRLNFNISKLVFCMITSWVMKGYPH